MQPIQINVSVNIGMTTELSGILSSLFSSRQIDAPERRNLIAANSQQVEIPADPQPKREEKTTEKAPVEAVSVKEYTEVDVREAIDRTRKRIEGENYKENTDGEGYKKWHRALNGWFKNTAAVCGGVDKPSNLPDSECRERFIALCDAVYVKDNELVVDCPY